MHEPFPTQTLSLNSRLRKGQQIVARGLGDAAVLLHLQTDAAFELNTTAARFWELVDGRRSIAEIADVLLAAFDVEPERLRAELLTLTTALLERGLLEPPTDE